VACFKVLAVNWIHLAQDRVQFRSLWTP